MTLMSGTCRENGYGGKKKCNKRCFKDFRKYSDIKGHAPM